MNAFAMRDMIELVENAVILMNVSMKKHVQQIMTAKM